MNDNCSLPLHQAIEKRIKEGYKSAKAIRKDAVKYTTHVLTGSHEKMKEIENDPDKLNVWIEENQKFIEEEFGRDNIVRFVLHRDEKTPHLHAVTVNLTQDGRLSAKEIIGNRTKMQQRQDKYAEKMAHFGLDRGIKSTGIQHEDAKKYYARIKESLEFAEKEEDLKENKTFLGLKTSLDIPKTINNYENALKREKTANKDIVYTYENSLNREKVTNKRYLSQISGLQNDLKSSNKQLKEVRKNTDLEIEELKKGINEMGTYLKNIFESPVSYTEQREVYIENTIESLVSEFEKSVNSHCFNDKLNFHKRNWKIHDFKISYGGLDKLFINELTEKYGLNEKMESKIDYYKSFSKGFYENSLKNENKIQDNEVNLKKRKNKGLRM